MRFEILYIKSSWLEAMARWTFTSLLVRIYPGWFAKHIFGRKPYERKYFSKTGQVWIDIEYCREIPPESEIGKFLETANENLDIYIAQIEDLNKRKVDSQKEEVTKRMNEAIEKNRRFDNIQLDS